MSNHYHIVGGRLGDYGKRADRKTLGQLRLPFIESRVGNVGCSSCNESSFTGRFTLPDTLFACKLTFINHLLVYLYTRWDLYTFSTLPTPPLFSSNSSASTALSIVPSSTPTFDTLKASSSFALNKLR